jgi:hypothetical protein
MQPQMMSQYADPIEALPKVLNTEGEMSEAEEMYLSQYGDMYLQDGSEMYLQEAYDVDYIPM